MGGEDYLSYKVSSSSSTRFNTKVDSVLDDVEDLEEKYALRDSSAIRGDPLYSTLGPIALCGELSRIHGNFLKNKRWPALSEEKPEANKAAETPSGNGGANED